jgi:hypothetical protein
MKHLINQAAASLQAKLQAFLSRRGATWLRALVKYSSQSKSCIEGKLILLILRCRDVNKQKNIYNEYINMYIYVHTLQRAHGQERAAVEKAARAAAAKAKRRPQVDDDVLILDTPNTREYLCISQTILARWVASASCQCGDQGRAARPAKTGLSFESSRMWLVLRT